MISGKRLRSSLAASSCVALTVSGCAFQGVNSLPLPGAVGRGPESSVYHVEIGNVATLEPNSPVMMNDVVVGSVRSMSVRDWHADVEFSVKPDVVVPANVVASIGQTSLLGSMHLAIKPPAGKAAAGSLPPGSTIPLNNASTYPTTEQTLSSLATVVNGGGLGQAGEIIHNFSAALNGRDTDFRNLLTRLDTFVGTLDTQRDSIVNSIQSLNRLASTFAGQRDVITRALEKIPPAMDVLIQERPRLTTALQKLGTFSDTANKLANESQEDLVRNLRNLEPAIAALADVGPELPAVLEFAAHYPFPQGFIDRDIRGDYFNLFATIDLTIPRLKRSFMLGTRWEQENAELVPAPGDPSWLNYTYDPLKTGVTPPPPDAFPPAPASAPLDTAAAGPPPPYAGPVLPVVPQQPLSVAGGAPAPSVPADQPSSIFAGPYAAKSNSPGPAPAAPPAPTTGGGG
ncbi:mammalian cell entry protein [Mycobacterium sp. E802]|uniref:MCE family protein n=1 Tax=Mycobacterium sp. E802 TaxID=1834152 RepID=UPI0007FDE4F3|nr:MCE family protein [Mycobacterium sp. E802]OBG89107.1 mammalian cell entry protein [Mycobacterium sp. E802]